MTGRRSTIGCSKSRRNDRHLSGPADSAAAAAGCPITLQFLGQSSAIFAITPWVWPGPGPHPEDEGRAARNNRRSFHRHADEFAWGLTVLATARRQWETPLIFLT